jgi:hypothetical protein
MELIIKVITVIGIAFIELWAAIPLGFALKLHPVLTGAASALGACLAAMAVIFFGDRLRKWLLRDKEPGQKNSGKVYRIWEKYGVIGLGLLAPLLTGALIGAAVGVSLGAAPGRLYFWLVTGITLWTVILVAAISVLGLQLPGH